ncbi:hypothetical protein DFH09DRAFT_481878 [Mycena vulgaris]|nr:hypothetical protein DFH09DRAFT_481878 [Mycena vulgaris]
MLENLPATPNLPRELERHIFEIVALSRPVFIPKLMRVAWRVKRWLEPLLYRTLVMTSEVNPIEGIPPFTMETFDRIARTKPASFLRDSVRNVVVEMIEVEQIKTILATCTGVENLWITTIGPPTTPPLPAVHPISLRHLYCDFAQLCEAASVIKFETFAQPFFSHLTHLELFNGISDDDGDPAKWDGITALAYLTHLAVDTLDIIPSCPHLLDGCKILRALIIVDESPITELPVLPLDSFVRDPRFVMMPLKNYIVDWRRGVLTGRDYWARADEFIAKRISGEIARSVYSLVKELRDSDDSDDAHGSDDSDHLDEDGC